MCSNIDFKDIPHFADFVKIKHITKGFSDDKKYYVETRGGNRMLLRIADISEFDRHEKLYNTIKLVAAEGVPTGKPVDIGICNDGKNVYHLVTWCDGEDFFPIVNTLDDKTLYSVGSRAGEILRLIHSVPEKEGSREWHKFYAEKSELIFKEVRDMQIEGIEHIIRFFNENKHLAAERPSCLCHCDYHFHNFIIRDKKNLFVLDWEMFDYCDPWYDFQGLNNSKPEPYYATGIIRGYFDGEPPESRKAFGKSLPCICRLARFHLSRGRSQYKTTVPDMTFWGIIFKMSKIFWAFFKIWTIRFRVGTMPENNDYTSRGDYENN